jgi:hypothetical protein
VFPTRFENVFLNINQLSNRGDVPTGYQSQHQSPCISHSPVHKLHSRVCGKFNQYNAPTSMDPSHHLPPKISEETVK